MRSKSLKAFSLALLLAAVGASYANAGVIYRVFYDGIAGTSVSDLVNATNAAGQHVFPDGLIVNGQQGFNLDGLSPLQTEVESQWFEGPPPSGGVGAENYGSMMQGYLEAPQTGEYTFWISGADSAELWLSTDATPGNAQKIAFVTAASGYRTWTAQATQKSAPVTLTSGQQYYVQVRHQAGTGNDYVSVGWTLPGASAPAVIPVQYLQPTPNVLLDHYFSDPQITQQPADVSVKENDLVVFAADVYATGPVNYRWFKGNTPNPITPVSGGVLSSLSFNATPGDDNTWYRLFVGSQSGVVLSKVVRLTVLQDTTPLTITKVSASIDNPFGVTVLYNKPVAPSSATDLANYAINNGVSIFAASMQTDRAVQLLVDGLAMDTDYTLTVNGVKDLASVPNVIAANTTANFSFAAPSVVYKVYPGIEGGSITNALDDPGFRAGAYDSASYLTTLEVPAGSQGPIIGQMQAVLTPPVTGVYHFFVASYSGCALYITTPDGKFKIAGGDSSSAFRKWSTAEKTGVVPLYAGEQYPLEVVFKGSGVGNFCSVGWQLPGAEVPADGSADGLIPSSALRATSNLGPVVLTGDPQNVTAQEGQSATFALPLLGGSVDGTLPISYQWYRNGNPIPNANGPSYTLPVANFADQGSMFTLVVANGFSLAYSASASLTVTLDQTAPTAKVGSLYTNTVRVVFSKPVTAPTAGAAANYTLNPFTGSAIPVTAATVVNATTVDLSVGALATGADYTLKINGVKDQTASGNAVSNLSVMFEPFNFEQVGQVNNAQDFSAVVDGSSLTLVAGGTGIRGTSDQFVAGGAAMTGDFDIKVNLVSVSPANDWSEAGIMARTALTAGSRYVATMGTAPGPINALMMQYRDVTGGAVSNAPTSGVTATYPNAWLRLKRTGSIFASYWSPNGYTWQVLSQKDTATSTDGAFPATVLVGLVATSSTSTAVTTALFDSYGPLQVTPTILGLTGDGSGTKATVTFSTAMDPASATNLANYALSGGLSISGASIDSTGTKVTLTTSKQTGGVPYSLTINNVLTTSGIMIRPNVSTGFSGWVLSHGLLLREVWNGIGDPLTNLKGSAKYPNSPDTVGYVAGFETPSNAADTYSQRVSGFIVPPTSGAYTFYVATDDSGELYLSTDEDPANKALIAHVAGWTGSREWANGTEAANQKSAPQTLVAGKMYYVEVLHSEGGGGDNLAVAWTLPGVTTTPATGSDPISGQYLYTYANPDLSTFFITSQPASLTVEQGRAATFTVGFFNRQSAAFVDWQQQLAGSSDWISAPGTVVNTATNSTLTTPFAALADNGASYRAVVNVPGDASTSSTATLTVVQDTTPPAILSVFNVKNGNTITVNFSESMNAATLTDVNNYVTSYGGPIITNVTIVSPSSIILTVDQSIKSPVPVFIDNVTDLAGNMLTGWKLSTVLNLADTDVGTKNAAGVFTDPLVPGYVIPVTATDFDMVAGGSDIWNKADGMNFLYKQVTGDFDAKVRVASLDRPDNWTKAGLMVREELAGDSKNISSLATPSTGQNQFQANIRPTKGADTAELSDGNNRPTVAYPNSWVRLQRVGNTFTCSYSTDGTTWKGLATNTPAAAFPATVYVGMACTSHNNSVGQVAHAQFRNFSIVGPAGPLAIVSEDENATGVRRSSEE